MNRRLRPIDAGGEDGWPRADVEAIIDQVIEPTVEALARAVRMGDRDEVVVQTRDLRDDVEVIEGYLRGAPPRGA